MSVSTGIGHTLNRPQGPLLKDKAYSMGKSSWPWIVPRYMLMEPAGHVLGVAVDVGNGGMTPEATLVGAIPVASAPLAYAVPVA